MNIHHEVVNIINHDTLLNSEAYEHRYVSLGSQPLRPGFYVVLWPGHKVGQRYYDESARYFGPYTTRSSAEQSLHKVTLEADIISGGRNGQA